MRTSFCWIDGHKDRQIKQHALLARRMHEWTAEPWLRVFGPQIEALPPEMIYEGYKDVFSESVLSDEKFHIFFTLVLRWEEEEKEQIIKSFRTWRVTVDE